MNIKSLNIAGNGIYTLNKYGYTQKMIDNLLEQIMNHLIKNNIDNTITSIRTGGQTGIDEAGAKAGMRLGIPTTILAPKGWKYRNIKGQDISDEKSFKERFNIADQQIEQPTQLTLEFKLKPEHEQQKNICYGKNSGDTKIGEI